MAKLSNSGISGKIPSCWPKLYSSKTGWNGVWMFLYPAQNYHHRRQSCWGVEPKPRRYAERGADWAQRFAFRQVCADENYNDGNKMMETIGPAMLTSASCDAGYFSASGSPFRGAVDE